MRGPATHRVSSRKAKTSPKSDQPSEALSELEFVPKASVRIPSIGRLEGLMFSDLPLASKGQLSLQSQSHPGVTRCLAALRLDPRLRVRDLTVISRLSFRGLNKAFRKHLGCPPGGVILMVRLRHALDLLANSQLDPAAIASSCGYRNANSLYVAFRRRLGVTPMSLRKPLACRKEAKSHGTMGLSV